MAPKSWLPPGGTNLFQQIKAWSVEAKAKGIKPLKLSIGQPTGPALLSARKAAARAVMSDDESMHEYQDNGSPGVPDFARRFVERLTRSCLVDANVGFLPTPGIKPMLGLVPLACGSYLDTRHTEFNAALMTKPGYPTPRDWCRYLRVHYQELPLHTGNSFRFSTADIEMPTHLVMMNYPHNPSGQTASQAWLEDLCEFCEYHDIRLFNDAAYVPLTHRRTSCTLTEVAINHPHLSWLEAFSASKVIGNGTGWRVGAVVGSPDFVEDLSTIKGNTDSGFVAFSAAGIIDAVEHDIGGMGHHRRLFANRLQLLIDLLVARGMRLAIRPGAGFFTLWQVPNRAFGVKIRDAEHFNRLMIERTGLVGVHFDPFIRYAVVGEVERMSPEIYEAFTRAAVSYN